MYQSEPQAGTPARAALEHKRYHRFYGRTRIGYLPYPRASIISVVSFIDKAISYPELTLLYGK